MTLSDIRELLPNGLGSKGDEVLNLELYPDRPLHILILATGSVASIKIPLIVTQLLKVLYYPLSLLR